MIDINSFASRHIGPRNEDINKMLEVIKCKSLDELIKKTVPDHILFKDKSCILTLLNSSDIPGFSFILSLNKM